MIGRYRAVLFNPYQVMHWLVVSNCVAGVCCFYLQVTVADSSGANWLVIVRRLTFFKMVLCGVGVRWVRLAFVPGCMALFKLSLLSCGLHVLAGFAQAKARR